MDGDDMYLHCGGISKFLVQSRGSNTKLATLRNGMEYEVTETGYQITPAEGSSGSSGFPTSNMFVSPQSTYTSVYGNQLHMLDCRSYQQTLDVWVQQYQMMNDERVCVQDRNGNSKYIMQPTKYALAVIKAVMKAVGDLHRQKCYLSPDVTFGVNILSKSGDYNYELEVIIIQGDRTSDVQLSVKNDIKHLDKLIFSFIFKEENASYLPSGLVQFRTKLNEVGNGRVTLEQLANHYSLINWEMRKLLIKTQHDGDLCLRSSDRYNWSGLIPSQGVLRQFYNEPLSGSSMANNVAPYRDTKGDLLRFMRNLFHHIDKKPYCDENHKKLEYVETVLSETFHMFYESFF